ncbi:hypothetical protein RRG08_039406, partial [Elysia crispata]
MVKNNGRRSQKAKMERSEVKNQEEKFEE